MQPYSSASIASAWRMEKAVDSHVWSFKHLPGYSAHSVWHPRSHHTTVVHSSLDPRKRESMFEPPHIEQRETFVNPRSQGGCAGFYSNKLDSTAYPNVGGFRTHFGSSGLRGKRGVSNKCSSRRCCRKQVAIRNVQGTHVPLLAPTYIPPSKPQSSVFSSVWHHVSFRCTLVNQPPSPKSQSSHADGIACSGSTQCSSPLLQVNPFWGTHVAAQQSPTGGAASESSR